MDVIGLLITKDDDEIFEDWCKTQISLYDAVICLDGSTTDWIARISHRFKYKLNYMHERDYDIPNKCDHGLRRIAHAEICKRFGIQNWVMCCHADEFCYHDPRKIAEIAERAGYDHVSWFSLHFLPHPSELVDWEQRQYLELRNRFRHYHWNHRGTGLPWVESRLYKNGESVFWDQTTHGSVRPHGLRHKAPLCPIYQHYKVTKTDLRGYDISARASHYKVHWTGVEHKTGLPFPVHRFEDFFVSQLPGYLSCDRFDGVIRHPWNIGEEFRPDGAVRNIL